MFLFLLIIAFTSCIKNKNNKLVEDMYLKDISIPRDSMLFLTKNNETIQTDVKQWVIIKYVDSLICSKCTINATKEWIDSLNRISSCEKIEKILIFSPKKKEYTKFIQLYFESELQNPIYIDTCNVFINNNKFIPNNSIYHVVLLNNEGKINLIGDPVHHKSIKRLFENIIKRIN